MTYRASQWHVFYMVGTSIMKELKSTLLTSGTINIIHGIK